MDGDEETCSFTPRTLDQRWWQIQIEATVVQVYSPTIIVLIFIFMFMFIFINIYIVIGFGCVIVFCLRVWLWPFLLEAFNTSPSLSSS